MKYKFLIVSLIVVSLLSGGCLPQDEAWKHFKNAADFIELQMLNEAMIELRIGLRLKEKDKSFASKPEKFALQGILYITEGNNEKAIGELEVGIKKYGNYWDIYPLLASLYMREKNYREAITILERMPQNDWGNTQLSLIKGMEYSDKGLYSQAIIEFEKAKEEFSGQGLRFKEESGTLQMINRGTNIILYNLLAGTYEKIGELDKALENYKLLEKLAPQLPEVKQNIAIIKYKIELKNNPKNAFVLNVLGWEYYQKRETDEAVSNYQMAINNNPTLSMAYNNLGLVYYDQKKYNKAIPLFEKVIELDNDSSAKTYASYNFGRIFRRHKDYTKAIHYFEQAMKLNPSYEPARREYKIAMLLLMLKSNPKNISLSDLGDAYYENGELDQALLIYKESTKKNPNNYQVYYNLGRIYFDKSMYDNAEKNYKKALLIKDDNWYIHEALANLYRIKNKYEQAIKEYEEALKNAPDNSIADIRNKMAYVYFEMGETKAAVAEWKRILTTKDSEDRDKIEKIINILEG